MRRTMRGGAAAVVAAVIAGVVLSACSSSPSTTTSTTSAPTTTTPTTAPVTTTTVAPSTTTTAAVTTCTPSDLHIVLAGSEGAAGTTELTFSLTSTAATVCTLSGYPGMLLLSLSNAPEPTDVVRGGGLSFENVPETTVSLSPGQVAYFNAGYSDVTTANTSCSMATQVEITPPNDVSYAVVAVSPSIDACDNGTIHVSPVFASTDSSGTQTTAPSG